MAQLTVRCRRIAREALFVKTISNEPNMNLIFSARLFIIVRNVLPSLVLRSGKFKHEMGYQQLFVTLAVFLDWSMVFIRNSIPESRVIVILVAEINRLSSS